MQGLGDSSQLGITTDCTWIGFRFGKWMLRFIMLQQVEGIEAGTSQQNRSSGFTLDVMLHLQHVCASGTFMARSL